MLRKITHSILALFLLVTTIGVTFSMHYCGDHLVSTSIIKHSNSCCNNMDGCCQDKTIHVEIKDNFISPVQIENLKTVTLDVLYPVYVDLDLESSTFEDHTIQLFNDSSSPPTLHCRLALLQTYLC